MATLRPQSSGGDSSVDPSPLLGPRHGNGRRGLLIRRPSLRGAARLLRRAGSRRFMRESSITVRETAAEQLEVRQTDWAYSKPVVVLDLLWNLAFVVVAVVVFILSREERPFLPLRLWIAGYVLQCVLHMTCVVIEYRLRHPVEVEPSSTRGGRRSGQSSPREVEDTGDGELSSDADTISIAKHLESANTMFSFIWWIVGFYWVSAGGQALAHNAPQLYWLCVIFLAFDVFFVVFCIALACFIGIAVCCCLPCIIAILYAVSDQEGASEEDIRLLPKYTFRRMGDAEKLSAGITEPIDGIMTECGSDPPNEQVLSAEDAECSICLSAYDDGVELRELPCGHRFHCACIDKWLHINATCPLCKFNIIKSSNRVREEV